MDVMAPMVAKGNMRVEPIFDVSWGGTSMLNAELAMAEALLEMGDWDYWINLSSTDYPLKPLDKVISIPLNPQHKLLHLGFRGQPLVP
jgi:hypothetical protein